MRFEFEPQRPMRRAKLWEIEPRFHCLVIGTCLTIEELRRLAQRAGIDTAANDYELHHDLVQLAGESAAVTRSLHKALERKFHPVIRRFNACRDTAALALQWNEETARGEVAGAFWALITHPLTDAELRQRVYGELHMLSHLAGHSHRSTQQQLAAVKRRVAELEEAHAWTAEASRLRIKELERQAEALAERAQRVDALERELAATRAQFAALETGQMLIQLRTDNNRLTLELEQALQRAESAERETSEWMQLALAAPAAPLPPGGSGDVLSHAPVSGEHAAPCASQCDDANTRACPGPDLCGRRILYVGGRERQVARLRTVVEQHNGKLLHHDGGRNEGATRLDALVNAADAVLCPLNCISHDACLRVKRLCKRDAKPFVPLRSGGLAGFIEGLREIGANDNQC